MLCIIVLDQLPQIHAPMLQRNEQIRPRPAHFKTTFPNRLKLPVLAALMQVALALVMDHVPLCSANVVLLALHLHELLSVEILLDLEDDLVNGVARRGKFLRQLVALLVSGKEINVLALHMLLKLLDCFQVVGLNCKVQRVHQVRPAQLIEIEEFEVAVDYFLQRDTLLLADVLDIREKLAHPVNLALVKTSDQGLILL